MEISQETKELIEKAGEEGAKRALQNIGLADETAGEDVRELRNLLDAWRGAKRTMGQTIIRMITTGILMALAVGIYAKFGGPK
jgi:multidrug resistance efflux pump